MRLSTVLLCAGVITLLVFSWPIAAQTTWDAGTGSPAGDRIDWFRDLNWDTNTAPGLGASTFDTNSGITYTETFMGEPNVRIRYSVTPGLVDPGIGSFHAQVPSGLTYVFRLVKDPILQNTLTTTVADGNFFHDGAGTYVIRMDDSSLRIGDPVPTPIGTFPFGGPFDADLYGFTIDFKGTPPEAGACGATIQASRTVGWGPLSVIDGCGVILAGVGDLFFTGQVSGGTIDCSYQLPTGLTPITGSRWEIDDLLSGAASSLTVVGSRITQIGDWDFIPSVDLQEFRTFVGISTNTLEMYPEHGTLQIHRTHIDVANNTAPATPDAAPTATFDGSSELIHTPGGFNEWFFTYANPPTEEAKALMSFLGRPALLRPSEYPTADFGPEVSSHRIDAHDAHLKIDIRSKVAREAKAYDTALTDLFNKSNLEIEAVASDCCNITYMDFLLPGSGGQNPSMSCLPRLNRDAKYWHNLDNNFPNADNLILHDENLLATGEMQATSNQDPDYVPANYANETFYFCKITGNITNLSPVMLPTDPPGLRMYARSFTDFHFPVVPLGLTRYMDADLDFDVDLTDFGRFQNAFTGQNNPASATTHATWYPLADYATPDAGEVPYISVPARLAVVSPTDGDVDLDDFTFFRARWQETVSSVAHVRTAANLPTANAGRGNGDPNIVVCGGPLHVIPQGTGLCTAQECAEGTCSNPDTCPAPALDCPNCEMYPGTSCPSGSPGGGQSAMVAGADGEDTGTSGEWPVITETPEEMAAAIAATLAPADLAPLAVDLLADGQATGDSYAVSVALLLGAGG